MVPPQDDAHAEHLLSDAPAAIHRVDEQLNFKVAIWQGDPARLHVDVIIICTNEAMSDRTGVSGDLLAAAGPQVAEACARLGRCEPGDAKATKAFSLAARHVVH